MLLSLKVELCTHGGRVVTADLDMVRVLSQGERFVSLQ